MINVSALVGLSKPYFSYERHYAYSVANDLTLFCVPSHRAIACLKTDPRATTARVSLKLPFESLFRFFPPFRFHLLRESPLLRLVKLLHLLVYHYGSTLNPPQCIVLARLMNVTSIGSTSVLNGSA